MRNRHALPDPDYETPNSDIVGLFERIAAMQDRRIQYVIVLTDLAETRRKVWPKLAAAKGEMHALALVVPATPKDAALTLGKPLSGPEQFELAGAAACHEADRRGPAHRVVDQPRIDHRGMHRAVRAGYGDGREAMFGEGKLADEVEVCHGFTVSLEWGTCFKICAFPSSSRPWRAGRRRRQPAAAPVIGAGLARERDFGLRVTLAAK